MSAMPPEAANDDRHSYKILAKPFSELLEHARTWRSTLSILTQHSNIGHFSSPAVLGPNSNVRRFYALGTCAGSKDHTIMYADIPLSFSDGADNSGAKAVDPSAKMTAAAASGFGEAEKDELMVDAESLRLVEWKPLLRIDQDTLQHRGPMTKEEELLQQRRRCMTQGITSYDYDAATGTFLFSASGHLYRCTDDQKGDSVCPSHVDVPLHVSSPLDPKICPVNNQLVACVCRNDIYIQFGPTARQATFSHEFDDESVAKLSGVPSFIIQEEFDRYSGYWWRPAAENDAYYVLYEETDESAVFELSINVPATRAEHVELMRYPRTGTNNPTWALKLLKIRLTETGDENFEPIKEDALIEDHVLSLNIRELFPWAEYLIRAGWMPSGKGIWFQLMSRIQDRLALVYAPLEIFRNARETGAPLGRSAIEAESMEDLTLTSSVEQQRQVPGTRTPVSVLYEEYTPDSWINYHDALQFLDPTTSGNLEFIWLSGRSGFYHLYHITVSIKEPESDSLAYSGPVVAPVVVRGEVQLTSGDWDVRRKTYIHVDQSKKFIYFSAFKESPTEPHIYVISYERPGPIRLLTEPGYSYGYQRDGRQFCLSADGRVLVTIRCKLTHVGECVVYLLNDPAPGDHLPQSTPLCRLSKNVGMERLKLRSQESGLGSSDKLDAPILFTYDSQRTGFRHYAYLFKPPHAKTGFKYPTILYVYAGPEVQLVKNVWLGSYGFQKYTSLGYAVVIVDGRGSANRGVKFEMALKHSLGTIEIEDQVEVLTEVANRSGVIDMERVSLLGWSYGGYMALLGLAQRPDVFKVAIAGGAVTVWSLYDTAYTERYMGMPQSNTDAYLRGSVLSYVDRLPSESGRLLLLHGLIDENVHFRHTSTLISALIRAGKPYQLQVFPTDRHAVRNTEVGEHMDATVLDFLQRNL